MPGLLGQAQILMNLQAGKLFSLPLNILLDFAVYEVKLFKHI